jgi:hypothetical protein
MMATPHALLERSIGELEILAASLAEEMGSACDGRRAATAEARVCKELLLSISVLLPKLQAARYVLPESRMDREAAGDPDASGRAGEG